MPLKYLIVNGDDVGATRGINRGIVEAHLHAVLTIRLINRTQAATLLAMSLR